MGTDVYLSWDGMTEEEEKARYTGFRIDMGRVGYLRASIWATRENAVLRLLFPEAWESEEGTPYDFKNPENIKKLHILARAYLLSYLTGKDYLSEFEEEKIKEMRGVMEEFVNALKKLNCEVEIERPEENDLERAVMWLNSLFAFYRLGIEKQEEGKNPKIYISW